MSDQIIKTARLTLRPPHPSDAAAVVPAIGNFNVARWLGSLPYPYHLSDAQSFISTCQDKLNKTWHVFDKTGLVGGCAIESELGYWLSEPAWGQGYGTEIADAMADRWFADPNAGDLPSGYHEGNQRSAHVLGKLGFSLTGKVSQVENTALGSTINSHKMALTRATWRANREFRLTTPRLTLREIRAEDWPDVQRIGGDPRVAPMLVSAQTPWPKEDVQQWIKFQMFRGRIGFRVAICLDHRLIGTAMFGGPPMVSAPTTAYFIDPDHWGNGYATEAMRAFLLEAMQRFQTPTIWADHFEDNPASGAVMRKLGFVETKRGIGESRARVEPAPVVIYRLDIANLKAQS